VRLVGFIIRMYPKIFYPTYESETTSVIKTFLQKSGEFCHLAVACYRFCYLIEDITALVSLCC